MADLSVRLGALTLPSPVLLASGTSGFGTELLEFLDLSVLGGVCTKGISVDPRQGNPPPRVCETPSGMLNAIGLENPGIERFVAEKVPFFPPRPLALVPNILGTSPEEYALLARRLDQVERVDAVEVNISCPNVKEGGVAFGTSAAGAAKVTAAVRSATRKPVIVKLSPNTGDIVAVARAAEAEGADAVSAINTVVGMAIDVRTRRPMLANVTGGLSGPAIRPIAVRMVFECANALRIPIVGVGGIMTAEDAIEFLLAGATAVQVGTATFVDPSAASRVARGIARYLDENGVGRVADLVGKVEVDRCLASRHRK